MRRQSYPRRSYYGRNNQLVVILVLAIIFVCGPAAGGSGYALIKSLTPDDIRFMMGAIYFLIAFITIAGGLSLVVFSYSLLHKKEDYKARIEQPEPQWAMLPSPAEQPVMEYQEVDFE